MAEEKKSKKDKKESAQEIEDPSLKKMMSKEMMRKIQEKIAGADEAAIKSIKHLIMQEHKIIKPKKDDK